MRAAARTLSLAALAAWAAGCENGKSTQDARTLQKLQQAQHAQSARGDVAPEDAPLFQLAPATPLVPRPLPTPLPQARQGAVRVTVTAVSSGPTVAAGRALLHTPNVFVRMEVELRNEGPSSGELGLAQAYLTTSTGGQFPLASDVQRAAGTKELRIQLPPGADRQAVLFFEVDRSVPSRPMMLTVSAVSGVPITLEIP